MRRVCRRRRPPRCKVNVFCVFLSEIICLEQLNRLLLRVVRTLEISQTEVDLLRMQLSASHYLKLVLLLLVYVSSLQLPGRGVVFGVGSKAGMPAKFSTRRLYMSSSQSIKEKLAADMKEAMKSKEKIRLGAIRSVQVAIKQKEVDDRVEVT